MFKEKLELEGVVNISELLDKAQPYINWEKKFLSDQEILGKSHMHAK